VNDIDPSAFGPGSASKAAAEPYFGRGFHAISLMAA
jgi:hypothetical protein